MQFPLSLFSVILSYIRVMKHVRVDIPRITHINHSHISLFPSETDCALSLYPIFIFFFYQIQEIISLILRFSIFHPRRPKPTSSLTYPDRRRLTMPAHCTLPSRTCPEKPRSTGQIAKLTFYLGGGKRSLRDTTKTSAYAVTCNANTSSA